MKKILILTLGTSVNSLGKRMNTTLLFNENKIVENSSFVAESLINNYKLDYIYILGTQNSSWSTFLMNYINKSDWDDDKKLNAIKTISPVLEIENEIYDKNKINKYQNSIQKIYEDYLLNLLNIKKIKVILLPYVINQEEIRFVYNKIFNQFENDFKEDELLLGAKEKYDVAFDITHSFRSLAIYNYAVLNYFKKLSSYEVNIKEIYYGMIEAKNINHNIVPIAQLGDLSQIIDLTNAVSEFSNTGSVRALISFLKQVQDDRISFKKIIEVLEDLDWAIGINSGYLLIESIGKLNDLVNDPKETDTIYDDIKNELRIVLKKPVFDDLQYSLNDIKKVDNPLKYADYQLVFSKWYFDRHRYSQSASIACEAFKSYIEYLDAKIKANDYLTNLMTGIETKENIVISIKEYKKMLKRYKSFKYQEKIEFLKKAFWVNDEVRLLRYGNVHNLQQTEAVKVLIDYIEIMKILRRNLNGYSCVMRKARNNCMYPDKRRKQKSLKVASEAVIQIEGETNGK